MSASARDEMSATGGVTRGKLLRVPSWYRDPNAPAPNQPLRIGVVALIERDGRLLVERRADDGTWSLVGGALEADESVGDALVREVREETGASSSNERMRLCV